MADTLRSSRVGGRSRTLVVLVAVIVALLVPALPAAHADSGMEGQFVAELNRERANAGLPALSTAGDLTAVARTHSGVMADENDLHHNPKLGSDVGGWQKVGENVGRGPTVSALHSAFMNSPGHRDNILDSSWTQVGVGVVVRDGTVWVTAVFRLPQGASAPEPKPEPEPEPKPEPKPETQPTAPAEPAPDDSGPSDPEPPAPVAEEPPVEEVPAEPEPHEVIEQPLPLDRVTLILAREEAAERSMRLEDVLG